MSEPRDAILELAYGYRAAQCLHAMASLGLADHLAAAPLDVAALAARSGANPGALARLVRALLALDLLAEDADGRVRLTPRSELLRSDTPASVRAEILHALHSSAWTTWGHLVDGVRSGRATFPELFGEPIWSYRARDREAGARFDAFAAECSRQDAEFVLRHLELDGTERIVDVGGGTGALLAALLARRPSSRGVLLERAAVADEARRFLAAAGLGERCEVVAGDFFVAVPQGELVILKAVLHNWPDAEALAILRACRRALPRRGRIAIVESLAESVAADCLDLHMLLVHGGRERSRGEYADLLGRAGFGPVRVRVEGRRALLEALRDDA